MVYKVGDLSNLLQSTTSSKASETGTKATTTDDVSKLQRMFDVKKAKVEKTTSPAGKKKNKKKRSIGAEFRVRKKKPGNKSEGSDKDRAAKKEKVPEQQTSSVKLAKKSKNKNKAKLNIDNEAKTIKKVVISKMASMSPNATTDSEKKKKKEQVPEQQTSSVKLSKKNKKNKKAKFNIDNEVKPIKKVVLSKMAATNTIKNDKKIESENEDNKDRSVVSPKDSSLPTPKHKRKKKKTKKDENTEGMRDHTAGFSPPQGMVHESLQKKPKKRKISMSSDDEEVIPKKSKPGNEKSKLKRKRRDRLAKDQDDATIFVGNLPLSIKKKKLEQLFRNYGTIEAIRYRCLPPNDPNVPKRVIAIKKDFHPDRNNCVAFIRFTEPAAAQSALSCNGRELDGLHIRVDMAARHQEKDIRKSVFVGNIPFEVEEEALREHFQDCGNIVDVRIIREKKTGLGKGFCYVRFSDIDGVAFAMRLNGSQFSGRELRVYQCQDNPRKTSLEAKDKKSAGGKHNKKIKPSNTTTNPFQGDVAKTKYEAAREKLKKQKLKASKKTKFFPNDKTTSKPGDSETTQVSDSRKRKIVDNSKDHSAKFAKINEGERKHKGGKPDTSRPKTSFQQKPMHSDKFKKAGGFSASKGRSEGGDKQPRKFDSSKSGANNKFSPGGNKGKSFGNKFSPGDNKGKSFGNKFSPGGNKGKGFGNKFSPGDNKGKSFGNKFSPGDNKGKSVGNKFSPGDNKGKSFGNKFRPGDNKGKGFGNKFQSGGNKGQNFTNKRDSFAKSGKFSKSPNASFQTTNKKSPKTGKH